ncbi:Hypothetical protein Minf_1471 [Methylacidiphilum infernorum V4]|uniref:Uncharacterized protein n=1 Tax=Methylacidiphilum infernorum (isolate V4) TaxID=481448 RepID=B3DW22_METI4|nr:Hypothetical protein Minf_1471 [Methylacidiphilum infernorum V4]
MEFRFIRLGIKIFSFLTYCIYRKEKDGDIYVFFIEKIKARQ